MDDNSVVYVGVDAAKTKLAVALAESGRNGEVRYLGEIDTSPTAVERLVHKLERNYKTLHFCYEGACRKVWERADKRADGLGFQAGLPSYGRCDMRPLPAHSTTIFKLCDRPASYS